VTDPVDERDDEMQARRRRERVFAEPFDRIDIALPNDAHAHQQEQHDDDNQRNQKTAHTQSPAAWPAS
jgi:hypothetical protein